MIGHQTPADGFVETDRDEPDLDVEPVHFVEDRPFPVGRCNLRHVLEHVTRRVLEAAAVLVVALEAGAELSDEPWAFSRGIPIMRSTTPRSRSRVTSRTTTSTPAPPRDSGSVDGRQSGA